MRGRREAAAGWSGAMTSSRHAGPLAALAALAVAVVCAGSAQGATVRCGTTITRDTTLTADLAGCSDNGIVIGADGVTLDLAGHTVSGDGALREDCPQDQPCDLGVLAEGRSGVVVKNGSVRGFALDVLLVGSTRSRLTALTATEATFSGILLADTTASRVDASVVAGNGLDTDQAGLVLFDSSRNRVQRTVVARNGDIGIFLQGGADNRIERTTVVDHPEAGIAADGVRNVLAQNVLRRNADGIIAIGDGTLVVGNELSDLPGCGEECGFGISVEGGAGIRVVDNEVRDAEQAGIRVAAFEPETPPTTGTLVARNRTSGTRLDGILIEPTATGTRLERNVAIGNGDDGIDVQQAASVLVRNTAALNGDLGIAAVAGVTDGGGNRAQRNGDPDECTNVACRLIQGP